MIFFVPRVMSLTNNLIVSKLRAFIDHVIVLSMLLLSFIVVILCGFFEWKRICTWFLFRRLFICVLPLEINLS